MLSIVFNPVSVHFPVFFHDFSQSGLRSLGLISPDLHDGTQHMGQGPIGIGIGIRISKVFISFLWFSHRLSIGLSRDVVRNMADNSSNP